MGRGLSAARCHETAEKCRRFRSRRRHPKAKGTRLDLRRDVLERNFKEQQRIMGQQAEGQSLSSIIQAGPSSWSFAELSEDELVLIPMAM